MSSRLDELLDKYDENPLDPDIIYSIVKEYLKSNMDDEAEDFLKDLIKKDPKYVQAYITYGNIKENNNEVEDAEYYYRTGLRIAKELNDIKAIRALEDYLDELESVSYTHLRAHETVLDLVCRLLLEKKKTTTTHTYHHIKHKTHIQSSNT